MTTFVLVHGAWHTGAAWNRVAPLLPQAVSPDLTHDRDIDLTTHVDEVVAAIDGTAGDLVLVGHSYAGLVVRQAADARPARIAHVVLIEGWAGQDGVSIASLAPDWFMARVRAAAGDGWRTERRVWCTQPESTDDHPVGAGNSASAAGEARFAGRPANGRVAMS